MARSITLPDDLLTQIEDLARKEGKTAEQFLRGALQRFRDDAEWRELVAYGHERAKALGLTASDVDRLIAETRRDCAS